MAEVSSRFTCVASTQGSQKGVRLKLNSAASIELKPFLWKTNPHESQPLQHVSQWRGGHRGDSDSPTAEPTWPESTTFQTINYGLDLKKSQPLDKRNARQQLGIESDAVLVGFGTDDANNHRKSIQHLIGALKRIQSKFDRKPAASSLPSQPEIEVLLFGSGEIQEPIGLP